VIDGRGGSLMMCVVAAAPHLFDDRLVASPELALVDVDLAAQLREDIRAGEEFRPRTVARPEFSLLHPVEIAGDAGEDDPAVDAVVELPEYVVTHDEIVVDVDPVVVSLEAPSALPVAEDLSELPDYVVASEETADAVGGGTAFLGVALEPAPEDVSDLPDYIVRADEDLVPAGNASVEEPTTSDYPVLPDLGEASVALEETDVALRKIREQMASEEPSRGRRRLRRGFIAASGLGAVAALALFAVDAQQGVATLPSWLGF
jgi:hypothetical protein